MNTWQEAKQIATHLTGRTPLWCDVRENNELAAAPIPEAMDDYIALDANGNQVSVSYWLNQRPMGENVQAVCYF